jgi:predicted nucleotidyltransferase
MPNKESVLTYLRSTLRHEYIIKAFVFGSFVTEKERPNDCDIFIVTNQTPDKNSWADFIKFINTVKNEFKKIFNLPLNASINTQTEFTEESAFRKRVLNRKIIDII